MTSCKLCGGIGWIIDENNNATSCKCRKEQILNNRIQFAKIPEAFKDIRLDTFSLKYYRDKDTISSVVKMVKYYLDHLDEMISEGVGLYLYSNTKGSGKTRLATSLANELMYKHDMSVRFATSLDIISAIKATWEQSEETTTESKLINALTTVEVLVIDDFGTETHKDWIDDKFYQIINRRYIDNLITIFTSNYQLDELEYDDRIVNRIKERVYQVKFPEESVRDGIAATRQQKMIKEIGLNG